MGGKPHERALRASKMNRDADLPVRSRTTTLTLAIFFLGYPPNYLGQVLFSRWLGAEDYGDYSVALSVAALVTTLTLLGLDKAVMKFVPLYEGPEEVGRAKGFLIFTFRTVIAVGLGLSVLGWIGTRLVEIVASVDEHAVRHAMFLVVPMSLSILSVQMLAARRRPVQASLVLKIVLPLTLVGLATAAHLVSPMSELKAVWVTVMANGLIVVALAPFLIAGWRKRFRGREPLYETGEWMAISRGFLAMSFAMTMLDQSGVLILELIHHDEADVGIFTAARFTAGYPLVALAALRMVSIPRFVRELEGGDRQAFERELGRNLRILSITGLAALTLWVVWGDAFLSIFGIRFESAHLTLVVLGVGYLGGLLLGFAPPILHIRGENRMIYRSTIAMLSINVGLAFLLVPFFGHVGAAIALAVSILAVGIAQAVWLEKKGGIPYLSLVFRPTSAPKEP